MRPRAFFGKPVLWLAGVFALKALSQSNVIADNSPRIENLVHESKMKKCIVTTDLHRNNPLITSDLPEALDYVQKNKDYSAYYLLYVLSKHYPKAYSQLSGTDKAAVLCSALQHVVSLDDWSILIPKSVMHDGVCAKLLLEIGTDALPYLKPLLDDANDAPLFGSQSATTSRAFQYRRKDFAYRYVSLILGREAPFRRNAADRDRDIEELKRALKNK